jgi:hypothetical protein
MLTVLLVTTGLVVLCVGIHYQSLVRLTKLRDYHFLRHRNRLNVLVLGALLAHVVELSCFSAGYWLLSDVWDYGDLLGVDDTESVHDYWYFSFVCYTSLGFGDITPTGSLRFMTALETLTGLVLIAWTASFIFLEMQMSWNADVDAATDVPSSGKDSGT